MPKALLFKSQFVPSQHFLLLNPIIHERIIFSFQRTNFSSESLIFRPPSLTSHKTHAQKPIICSKKNKSRSGSQKIIKIFPKLIYILASHFKILPEPLDLVIGEFGGGDGGGLGFWKGFKGGSFDRWRRKGKRNLGVLGLGCLLVSGLSFFYVLLGKELKSDVLLGVLALGFFGALLIKGFKEGFKDCVLGVCVFGALLSLGRRREVMQKWVERVRASAPVLEEIKGRKRRNGRRVF